MKFDLLIKNAKIYLNGTFCCGNVLVKAGKISEITDNIEGIQAEKTIDAAGKYLLPGMIESHMHIREPGRPDRGTFFTETMAAAAGGVTTILEHPIANPPQYSKEILDKRIEDASDKCVVDFAFYGAAGAKFPDKIKEMGETGIVAFKTFLHEAPEGRDTEFIGLTMANDGEMYHGFRAVAKTGKLCAVHSENNDIITSMIAKFRAEGKTDPIYHCLSRPKFAEIETVSKLLLLAKDTGVKLIFCHTTVPEAMEMIKKAKGEGMELYLETCPQYLFLTEEDVIKHGVYAKCNPPLRKQEDVDGLWKYVTDGTVDFIGSDHATYTVEEKEKGRDDIFKAPSGFLGVDLRLPLMLNAVNEGKLSFEKCIDLLSTNVAKAFKIFPQKGVINVGSDADFVIVDMDKTITVDKSKNYSKAKEISRVFEGKQLKGTPIYTIVRGKVVMKDGVVDEKAKGWGKLIETYNK
ncbi:dihydroorotase family protein [Fusobacterium ulcerans]|uniref:dihydroorotase n=1 Tax=Fusobacterium ulcerans TaxID=861 RepID=UPI0025E85B95|nr:dihydroorotase family protein [Fusobacterium ulcerans]